MSWWESIEQHLADSDEEAPDPWADRVVAEDAGLTDDQEAFLAGLSDQPVPPRIAEPDHLGTGDGETGNSPGDEGSAPGVPSSP